MKRFFFPALAYLFLIFPSYASAQTNTVTLTSYYPAPFGAYDRLRLVPRASLGANCTAGEEGSLYIPITTNMINQCTSGSWMPLSGGVIKLNPIAVRVDTEIPTLDVDQYTTTKNYPDLTTLSPYLGIGTSNPLRPLHIVVNNQSAVTALAIENTDSNVTSHNTGATISFRGNSAGAGGGPFTEMASIRAIYNIEPPKVESSLDLYVRDGLAGSNIKVFTISGYKEGRAGVRTPFPQAILDVNTAGSTTTTAFAVSAAPGIGDIFSILTSGNVGINKNAPTEKLEVVGNIKATTLILTSDAGLKKDIVPVENSLDKISRLKGVSFEWKDNPADQRKHMGVIAQDVEKIFPEAVYGQNGDKGVDYPSLIAPLIEAVKELKEKNEVLSQQLQIQSSQIKEQQQKIESLQNSLKTTEPALTP